MSRSFIIWGYKFELSDNGYEFNKYDINVFDKDLNSWKRIGTGHTLSYCKERAEEYVDMLECIKDL